jgi:transcriptional regulator with PAS, ATPase and Fis domain
LDADLPVLIEGETGVGKEWVAHALHLSSRRRGGPFVAVNCAAIPGDLLEAEMFGIGAGVATGVKKRQGKFLAAHGGTLFLDELGEMPLALQAKLLRALQEKEVQPLGGTAVPVDVWVLAATNVDLERRAEEGSFRRDLYYRVAGAVLKVPPLRQRRDDVAPLVEHFLRQGAKGKSILGVTRAAFEALVGHSWPGNVRELEHEVRRLAHLVSDGGAVESSMLAERLLAPGPEGEENPAVASLRLEDHVREAERRAIVQALEHAGGSQRQAARLLGIARSTLLRKLRELDVPT